MLTGRLFQQENTNQRTCDTHHTVAGGGKVDCNDFHPMHAALADSKAGS